MYVTTQYTTIVLEHVCFSIVLPTFSFSYCRASCCCRGGSDRILHRRGEARRGDVHRTRVPVPRSRLVPDSIPPQHKHTKHIGRLVNRSLKLLSIVPCALQYVIYHCPYRHQLNNQTDSKSTTSRTQNPEEFHRQGDLEAEKGVPVSPLCSREGHNQAKSQCDFVNFVVRPCAVSISATLLVHVKCVMPL